jgi:hypothetical protein
MRRGEEELSPQQHDAEPGAMAPAKCQHELKTASAPELASICWHVLDQASGDLFVEYGRVI